MVLTNIIEFNPISRVVYKKIFLKNQNLILLECLGNEEMKDSYTSWKGSGFENCKGRACYLRVLDINFEENYSCLWFFENFEIMRKYFIFIKGNKSYLKLLRCLFPLLSILTIISIVRFLFLIMVLRTIRKLKILLSFRVFPKIIDFLITVQNETANLI